MSSHIHRCDRGGALVSGAGVVLSDPADFVWTPAAKGLGCGNLVCSACHAPVKASSPTPDGGRSYRCGCAVFVAYAQSWLEGQAEDGPSGREPASWACGGHAPRKLPVDLDGVQIQAQPDWRSMLAASVQGRLNANAVAWLPAYPNAWLERLVATVDDAEQARFGDVISGLLDGSDVALRQAGLDLAERLGLKNVTAALVERIARGAFDWKGDDHLTRFAVEQLRRASVGTDSPDAQLKDALRSALLARHGGPLVFAAGRHDPDWLADNAVALSEGTPRAKARLLNALADHPEAAARAKGLMEGQGKVGSGLRARWVLIDAPPGSGTDACTARLGLESTQGEAQVLGDVVISPCKNLQDALEKALAVIAELKLPQGPVFSLIYPHYPAAGALEAEMHRIAWAIKDAADQRGWEFLREMPVAAHHLS